MCVWGAHSQRAMLYRAKANALEMLKKHEFVKGSVGLPDCAFNWIEVR